MMSLLISVTWIGICGMDSRTDTAESRMSLLRFLSSFAASFIFSSSFYELPTFSHLFT